MALFREVPRRRRAVDAAAEAQQYVFLIRNEKASDFSDAFVFVVVRYSLSNSSSSDAGCC